MGAFGMVIEIAALQSGHRRTSTSGTKSLMGTSRATSERFVSFDSQAGRLLLFGNAKYRAGTRYLQHWRAPLSVHAVPSRRCLLPFPCDATIRRDQFQRY